ncbi:ABC transporter permease [Thermococcus thioreducens]|uniref:Peptide transporter n=1 Tax=Thermococcus thioreducens TaxID=277988 RepID=A0A0Q2S2W5_9EURY|nr:ABC transporter permease [Thermococcus thioreducens]ASJ11514.1 peptide transporter [Thermococcus thioreducens]KQH81875.1 peptide transporter [Thermococcus thioreducens]SEW05332.1 peptide/nickel transport system permease protein [Thermococcus thioreducens]
MRWVDVKEGFKEFLEEFKREKTGIAGVILLVILVLVALTAPYTTIPDLPEKWRSSAYWEDNPKNVPPTWYNMFTSQKLVPQEVYYINDLKITHPSDTRTVIEADYNFPNRYILGPQGIIIRGLNVSVGDPMNAPVFDLYLLRPDGKKIPLLKNKPLSAGTISVGRDSTISANVYIWLVNVTEGREITMFEVPLQTILISDMVAPMFAKVEPGMNVTQIIENPEPLWGNYKLVLDINNPAPDKNKIMLDNIKVTFLGRSYGTMGTDYLGRDLWAGIIWGSRVSLTIGVLVSVLSTVIGLVYGVTSAYLGGNADEFMMRINEIFASIPSLPILILIGATMGHITLMFIVLLLVIFGWMGIARISRSMALQIKEQTYIEAARALGAGNGRIIFKHILPQLLPYAFAVIALSVPSAVIAEASLSFLGIGDPTAVTWGQILNAAQNQAATTKGYWWWVLPPGLGIAVVGLTFVLIGTALDKILNPRLRRL